MDKIPVIIVDDNETDRYIAKRRLSKDDSFGEIMECQAGDQFLHEYFNGHKPFEKETLPVLVLMDVNMPRMSGFETVQELQRRVSAGKGLHSVVVMIFSSSSNPEDLARAEQFDSIRGYINKPLDADGVTKIRESYFA